MTRCLVDPHTFEQQLCAEVWDFWKYASEQSVDCRDIVVHLVSDLPAVTGEEMGSML